MAVASGGSLVYETLTLSRVLSRRTLDMPALYLQAHHLASHCGMGRPTTVVIGLQTGRWRRSADHDRRFRLDQVDDVLAPRTMEIHVNFKEIDRMRRTKRWA